MIIIIITKLSVFKLDKRTKNKYIFVMMNKNNISIISNPGYGGNFSRTLYDVRQEINAKVIGVLNKNNKIRNELLKRNIGIYPLLSSDNRIGYISNIYSNLTSKPISFDEKGLLGYTHLNKSDFQKNINQRYNFNDSIKYYSEKSLPDINQRQNRNYLDYIDEVFGFKLTTLNLLSQAFSTDKLKKGISKPTEKDLLTIRSVLNDFLQYDNIKYAMEKTRIGTITPKPLIALEGINTTNINNFSGTDTPLGIISNYFYAHTLKNSAQFNSLRKTQYITASSYDLLGNKLNTISTLASDFRIDDETGRIAHDLGDFSTTETLENTSAITDLFQIDLNKDIANSHNGRVRNIMRNKYQPFTNFKYEINNKTLINASVNSIVGTKIYTIWDEGDDNSNVNFKFNSKDGLLEKTEKLFSLHNEKGNDTLISRFHTSGNRDLKHNEVELFQTSITNFGMSHGRNLLNKKAYTTRESDKINGYNNPYCRVWTHHHQYDSVDKLIRSGIDVEEMQNNWWQYGRVKDSAKRLKDNSVLNKNSFVNITPNADTTNIQDSVKKCMFSIENLAWKDVLKDDEKNTLNAEQIGPNGGRIMWFPPYNLKFSEQVSSFWQPNTFIGRGENIYTYTNTERRGQLSFDLLVDYPSILDMWKNNTNAKALSDVDKEQQILRFFAGCDELTLDNKPTIITTEVVEENKVEETPPENKDNEPQLKSEEIISGFTFYIFFPNNYSGVDDTENKYQYLADDYESANPTLNKILYNGYKWQYRVDEKYKKQKLKYTNNYNYTKSDKLNYDIKEINSNKNYKADFSFYNVLNEKLLNNQEVTKVEITSASSSHGYNDENKKLSKNRALYAKNFLIENCKIDGDKIKILNDTNIEKIKTTLVNSIEAKRARHVKVVVTTKIIKESVENFSDINQEQINTIPDGTKVLNGTIKKTITTEHAPTPKRWEVESEYFNTLKMTDSFLYKKIIDKVKNFNPAFHSITPEGFNARLGFLHQCTRQGNTYSVSDRSTKHISAGNLAFGRPPICVLRVGDFFHTKIIIDSINIDYDDNRWDINPEGIGMQPLYAKISISFIFLGGSDLTAPISRLQNALSFNYYANQSIYDDRADIGIYENKKPKIKGTPWKPNME